MAVVAREDRAGRASVPWSRQYARCLRVRRGQRAWLTHISTLPISVWKYSSSAGHTTRGVDSNGPRHWGKFFSLSVCLCHTWRCFCGCSIIGATMQTHIINFIGSRFPPRDCFFPWQTCFSTDLRTYQHELQNPENFIAPPPSAVVEPSRDIRRRSCLGEPLLESTATCTEWVSNNWTRSREENL